MTTEQLVARCQDVGSTAVDYIPSIQGIMTPFEFGSRVTRNSTGYKAPGFDCSMPELAQIDPKQYIRLLHPVHVKMSITATAPAA